MLSTSWLKNWNSTRRRRPAKPARPFQPRLEILEDRRLLANGMYVEDFSDDSNPQNPGFDSSGVFLHSGLAGQIHAAPTPPSPPYALALFGGPNQPHLITFSAALNVDYAGVWVLAQGGPAVVEFLGSQGSLHFDFNAGATSFVFRDTTGANLGQITTIRLLGAEVYFDNVTIHAVPSNNPPTAQDDQAAVLVGSGPNFIDVLANDTTAPDQGEVLSVFQVSQSGHGSVAIAGDSIGVTYTPNPGFTGIDVFTYTAYDGRGGTATATVTVSVNAPDENLPQANDDTAVTFAGDPVTIDLLANDSTDPDTGEPLTVDLILGGTHGTISASTGQDGTRVIYAPNPGFVGTDPFTYTVSDSRGRTDVATVTVTVLQAPPSVRGQKFEDRNGNATRDADEQGLNGWLIELVNAATGAVVASQRTRDIDLNGDFFTDPTTERGRYRFDNVEPGDYVVREEVRPEWNQILPVPGTQRVSVSATGAEANSHSSRPALSHDGRYAAFVSLADNLVPGDTNGEQDIFVKDRVTGAIERVSVSSTGAQADGPSFEPDISSDGRLVVFRSRASNLVPGDSNEVNDIFVYDRSTHVTRRVSVNLGRDEANDDSLGPVLSGDGRWVAFESTATNLVPGDTNGVSDIFLYDLHTGLIERVSRPGNSFQANGPSHQAAVSNDGVFIAYTSYATNLVPSDVNDRSDVFVFNRLAHTVIRGSAFGTTEGNGDSFDPALSGDGTVLVFASRASDLVQGDSNRDADVFVHRLFSQDGFARVSVTSGGVEGNAASVAPSLDDSGTIGAFVSYANNLVPGDRNARPDVFRFDLRRGVTQVVSLGMFGFPDEGSLEPAMSGDARFVAFTSYANDLVADDTNAAGDVVVRTLSAAYAVTVGAGEVRDGMDFGNRNRSPGTVEFSAANYQVSENDGLAAITLTRTGGSEGLLTVRLTPAGVSATAGQDFIGLPITITFGPGDTSRTVNLGIIDDGQVEARETIRLTLSVTTATGAADTFPGTALLTIVDDDNRPAATQNEAFVAAVYGDGLDREVDAIGLAFWSGILDRGGNRTDVARGILNSTEYRERLVRAAYADLLRRTPDETGFRSWTQFLERGGTSDELRMQFYCSPEYRQMRGGGGDPGAPSGGDPGFIDALYHDVLGRPFDPVGAEAWGRLLRESGGCERVVEGIMRSNEAGDRTVRLGYSRFLHRSPDLAGGLAFRRMLQAGEPMEEFFGNVVSSPEYGCLVNSHQTQNTRFVAQMYADLLQRPPTCDELDAAIDQLSQGETRESLALALTHTPEYRLLVTRGLVEQFLHQNASGLDAAGVEALFADPGVEVTIASSGSRVRVPQYQTGIEPYLHGLDDYNGNPVDYLIVLSHVASSTAYGRTTGTLTPMGLDEAGYLNALFQDLMAPIAEEDREDRSDHFFGAVTGTNSPPELFVDLLPPVLSILRDGPDRLNQAFQFFLRFLVHGYYQRFLHREPDAGGFGGWVTAMRNNHQPAEQVIAGFVGSSEYFMLAQA